ncbi:HEAT repeat domain-containing protein [uncultured Gimesia sp.]|uniref:HEAT repeat domain-containing protein n=1 Tax=uncultured Gimesia sp. TaxID=1678688 RepID=UPI0030DA8E36|tara:strand:- start:24998 stop:25873 length:876 start_codon:yes stop_codon:yes gene_type:complete
MRQLFLISMSTLLTLASIPSFAWALGIEDFGNKPLHAENFRDWPGIMPVVNHQSRVYHRWINGNEHCFYRGDAEALNDALQKFAATEEKVHEVVLRPGPATVSSFNASQTMDYNWSLHLVGGIARAMSQKDQGAQIWSKYPILTVYVAGTIELDKIKIPKDVTLLQLADLEQRYTKGLTSTDITVRGWSAGQLARLDPYSKPSMETIAKLLSSKEKWVRRNAVGALATFGKQAAPTLPALRDALKTDDKQLKTQIENTIQTIEQAPDRSAEKKQHQETLGKISQFCKSLKK